MKKSLCFLFFAFITAGVTLFTGCNNSNPVSTDSNFEGIVTYEIKVGAGLAPEAVSMLQSVEMKTFVKGNLTRSEEDMSGYYTVMIADSKKPDDLTMLFNIFGHKYAVKRNDSLRKIAESIVPKIVYIDSANTTKQIAGYTCKKARITITLPGDSSITNDIYYTTALPYANPPEGEFKGLKGMPMEFNVRVSGLNLTISAKSVEKKVLADSLFTIPPGYREMDIDSMRKDIMKNMGSDSAKGAK